MAFSTGRFPIYFFIAWQWKRSICKFSFVWAPWDFDNDTTVRHSILISKLITKVCGDFFQKFRLRESFWKSIWPRDKSVIYNLVAYEKWSLWESWTCKLYVNLWILHFHCSQWNSMPSTWSTTQESVESSKGHTINWILESTSIKRCLDGQH